jgi:predicted dehydrogenase
MQEGTRLAVSERIRVGVVGVGYLGSIHARIYSRMPSVKLVGVADIDAAVATRVAHDCACAAFRDGAEMLDAVDAVSIVVPTTAHLAVAEPFLRHGVHMLLEKPIASTVTEAENVVELAGAAGVVLQIGHLERFNAGVMTLAEHVENPRFIEVHRLGTFSERGTDVDVVTDLMIHDIDIVLSLVDSGLRTVAATGIPVVTSHVDIANARLEFDNGAVANVTASRVSSKKFRRIRVFAQSRYLALNFQDQQIEILRPGTHKPAGGFPDIISEQLAVEPRQPLDAELENFIETVRTGAVPLVGGTEALAALKVADLVKHKIHQSMSA